jgi:hypothetical protein
MGLTARRAAASRRFQNPDTELNVIATLATIGLSNRLNHQ